MNRTLPDPETTPVSSLLQSTANNIRAELARKRAQRHVESALQGKNTDSPPIETLPETTPEVDVPLDLTLDTWYVPPAISVTPTLETKKQSDDHRAMPISPKAIHYAATQRDHVRELLKNTAEFPLHITEEAILESIAIMQTQEEQWDKLKINQISIPLTEVTLWSSFFKIFSGLSTEKYINHPFEKGDTFELKIPGFHMFHMTRIRKSEKESLTFCVVQSKLHSHDTVYVFEVLVKLPIREWGMLEIYRNRVNGPEQINSWRISEILLKRPKSTVNYESGSEKGGILWILWM